LPITLGIRLHGVLIYNPMRLDSKSGVDQK